MFRKVLVANRGEIAVRIVRALREASIASVAVYSDADRTSLAVQMADEAVHLGPSPAADSYLRIDKIIESAHRQGVDAIHPGYGFLTANPHFPSPSQPPSATPPAKRCAHLAMERCPSKSYCWNRATLKFRCWAIAMAI